MHSYNLTATLSGKTKRVRLYALDDESALFQAISEIMDRAHKKANAWALGQIILERNGEILATMREK